MIFYMGRYDGHIQRIFTNILGYDMVWLSGHKTWVWMPIDWRTTSHDVRVVCPD